jgi:1-acyl-sn-glycerol-3-phosphate acyltransferase
MEQEAVREIEGRAARESPGKRLAGDGPQPDVDAPARPQGRTARALAQAEQRLREAKPPDARTYALGRILGKFLFGVCTGEQVAGLERIPREGPLLIVANHLSYLEPPLIATVVPRRITFMAGYELWEIGWLSWMLRTMQALPVRRGGTGDLEAIRTALTLLKQGEAVAVFPEGRISESRALLRAKPGVSLLAQRSGAPIVPIGISGTERLDTFGTFVTGRWRRPRVRVNIGAPFIPEYAPGRPDHQAMADLVMEHLAAQMPEAYRGEYGTRN